MRPDMNITRARLIVRNPETYTRDQVREAAIWILGSLAATSEDVNDASACLSR